MVDEERGKEGDDVEGEAEKEENGWGRRKGEEGKARDRRGEGSREEAMEERLKTRKEGRGRKGPW